MAESTATQAETPANPQAQVSTQPARVRRSLADRVFGREDPAVVAKRKEQEEAFRAPLRIAFQELTEGKELSELGVGPHQFGKYAVKFSYGSVESMRMIYDKRETITLTPEATKEVFVRKLETLKDGVAIHVDRSSYDFLGNAVVESGDVGPGSKLKPIRTEWQSTPKQFESPEPHSISDGEALANLVRVVRFSREEPARIAEAEQREAANTRRREQRAAKKVASKPQ